VKLTIFRRTTRTAWRKESRSGSSSTWRAASCMSPRMAEVGHHQSVELLDNQVRGLAPQYDARSPQVCLQFIKRRLDFQRS